MKKIILIFLSLFLSNQIALAQLTAIGVGGGFGAGGVSPATYTPIYADAQDINFASSSYTSPSQTWTNGVAIVAVIQAGTTATLTAVTINGVSATQIGGYSTGQVGSLWRANVTAGSGTVQITGSGVFGGLATAGGVITTTTTTPSSSQIADMAVASEPQGVVTLTVPSNGVGIVFGGASFGSAASLPCTWAAGGTRDAITEAAGVGGGSANSVICGAHTAAGSTTTPTVATANGTFNFTGTSGSMVAVAFSP